ncbi:MAG: prefoldin subunit alpha [Desulfurococcales archaeon]|nr:prefoldin subunit alpha [Desulfurococcales archaeon]
MAEEKAVQAANKLEEELRTLFGQAESIRQQIETINATVLDLATVIETLDYIKGRGKDKVVLVPIGAGNFVRAKIVDTEHVIMGVGGRLSVEASVDDAKELINQRIESLERLRLDLRRKLEELNARIRELVTKIQQSQQ